MNTRDLNDRPQLSDETSVSHKDFLSNGSNIEELLAINWQLVLRIDQESEDQCELTRQFNEELDELFSLIHSPVPPEDRSPDPPDWPNL